MSPSPSRGEGGGFQAPTLPLQQCDGLEGNVPKPGVNLASQQLHMGRARRAPFHLLTWPCPGEVVQRHNALRFLSSQPQTSR